MKNALKLDTTQILECPKITFTFTCLFTLLNTYSSLDSIVLKMLHDTQLKGALSNITITWLQVATMEEHFNFNYQ